MPKFACKLIFYVSFIVKVTYKPSQYIDNKINYLQKGKLKVVEQERGRGVGLKSQL